MNYEEMSREQLLATLRDLTENRHPRQAEPDQLRLLHELQVHQIELEMQNRELRDAHGALEESRNRYADLYDFAPIAYCTLDPHGVVQELNLTAATLFGKEPELVVGRPFTSLVALDNPKRFWHHLGACAARGEPMSTELILKVQGRTFFVEVVSVPVFDLRRKVSAFRTAFTDITKRKLAEAEREEALSSERRLRADLELLQRAHMQASHALTTSEQAGLREVMTVIADSAQRLVGASWVRLTLTGAAAAAADTPGYSVELGTLPSITNRLQQQLAYGGRSLAELTLGRPEDGDAFSGEERHTIELLCERMTSALEIARLRAADARENLRLSLLEQVGSELRAGREPGKVEQALEKVAGDLLPSFADVVVLHLFKRDKLKLICVRHVDPQQASLLHTQLAEAPHEEWLPSWLSTVASANYPTLFRSAARDSTPPGVPTQWRALLATLSARSLIVAPIRAREKLLGTFCFARLHEQSYDLRLMTWAQEIAERCSAALDAALLLDELREALSFRENLMAMISHDLKSPLSAIAMSAMSLRVDEPMVERRSSYQQVQLIQRSATHMNNMINDLLATHMLERGSLSVELKPEQPAKLLEEACQLTEPLVAPRRIELSCELGENLPDVLADRERLLRVFANLIGNAIKFTPPKGRIWVSASARPGAVRFSVRDTGPGVPGEQRARLFDRYWKGKSRSAGLGLGLYIAKSVVEAHGGRIWVEGRDGEGATFCFELPAAPQQTHS